jgi:hypothetical protein
MQATADVEHETAVRLALIAKPPRHDRRRPPCRRSTARTHPRYSQRCRGLQRWCAGRRTAWAFSSFPRPAPRRAPPPRRDRFAGPYLSSANAAPSPPSTAGASRKWRPVSVKAGDRLPRVRQLRDWVGTQERGLAATSAPGRRRRVPRIRVCGAGNPATVVRRRPGPRGRWAAVRDRALGGSAADRRSFRLSCGLGRRCPRRCPGAGAAARGEGLAGLVLRDPDQQ